MTKENKTSFITHILWMILALLVSIGLSEQIFIGSSFLHLSSSQKAFLVILSIGFLLSGILNFYSSRIKFKYFKYISIPLVTLVSFSFSALLLLFLQIDFFSRTVFTVVILLNLVALFLADRLRIGWQLLVIIPLLISTMALQYLDKEPRKKFVQFFASQPVPQANQAIVNTAYLSLKVKYFDNYFQVCQQGDFTNCWPRTGGGIEALDGGYLVATGEGRLHYLLPDAKGVMNARQLKTSIPINDSDFALSGESEYGQGVFRVTDILPKLDGQDLNLLASHHFWHKENDCVVLRVSSLKIKLDDFLNGDKVSEWNTVFESKPCMPRSAGDRSPKFHGEESGGKMIWRDANTILMTTGDHHFDGWNSTEIAPQDPASDYGKTLLINIDSGLATVFTLGHRNPQGLAEALDGSIWETEHGPRGGDELNLLLQGGNYGWPLVTYGTEYGQKTWPIHISSDNQHNFIEPIYSWVPSIAVSNLIQVKGALFQQWHGDLLIASYSKSLHRARIREGRVITLEPIPLRKRNGRIRDLIEDAEGRIVLMFDTGSIAIVEPVNSNSSSNKDISPAMRGEMLFSTCLGCHTIKGGTEHGIGPDLATIYNRPIASALGYNYSEGLSNVSGSWSADKLDGFLADPQTFAPGNKMQIEAVADKKDRTSLINYMQSLHK